ncbi:MAG: MFS transporter [Deltaproteobacteria bacterium]|nr:MFS transporter [Deltaproteobacteria bacterium]
MTTTTKLSTTTKLALLSTLYFSQGLPYGFFTKALPVWMRQEGMALPLIGFASTLLALPWALKVLWAPLVDRWSGSRLGRRRGWILPLQGLSALTLVTLAFIGTRIAGDAGSPFILALAIGMFVTNLMAATQDIATDGLAVDLLTSPERGLGNGVQVAAYRVGMIAGGGALLAALAHYGWTATFLLMAGLIVTMSVPIALWKEPTTTTTTTTAPVSFAAVLQFLFRKDGRMLGWCFGIGLFKIGDALGSPMVSPLLVDKHYSIDDIALLLGTLGSAAGMIGALLGGLLARRGRLLALVVCGLVHAGLMASYALPVFFDLDPTVVGALVVIEHLTGGMATVALFTAMMDACDPQTGATDYTTQASIVVLASGMGGVLSGVSAANLGYATHFVVAGVVCVIGALAMVPLYRFKVAPRDPSFDDELSRAMVPQGSVSSSSSPAAVSSSSPPVEPE